MNNSFLSKAILRIREIKPGAQESQSSGSAIKGFPKAAIHWVIGLISVNPRSLDDYYSISGLLVAKKLIILLLLLLGTGGGAYLLQALPAEPVAQGDAVAIKAPAFRYFNPSLKSYSGPAQILAKKKELVYTGDILSGKATGQGILYNRKGVLLYTGEFRDNCYNGSGTLYYPSGGIRYSGEFVSNVYQGQGTSYGKSGVREYEGKFENGMRNGEGVLYSSYGSPIYQGSFYMGEPDFRSFLGGKAENLSGSFTGHQTAYLDQQLTVSHMTDFQLLYEIYGEEGAALEEASVERVYYIGSKPAAGDYKMTGNELDAVMDELYYKGDTLVTTGEYAALDGLRQLGSDAFSGRYQYRFSDMFSDVKVLTAKAGEELMYIRSYSFGSYFYTFYFSSPEEPYIFYSVEQLAQQNQL